jgi:CYTH domain-containing protein
MKIEKEQKFLLKYLPDNIEISKKLEIKQAYLIFDKFKQVRIRVVNDSEAFLCYKSKIDGSDFERYEYEYQIPIQDGLELFNSTNVRIEKTRFEFKYVDLIVVIDQYVDFTIVEIEYESDDFKIPDFCGENISLNENFSNLNIAIENSKIFQKSIF